MSDMHLLYGLTEVNGSTSQCIYKEKHPNSLVLLYERTLLKIYARLVIKAHLIKMMVLLQDLQRVELLH